MEKPTTTEMSALLRLQETMREKRRAKVEKRKGENQLARRMIIVGVTSPIPW